METQVEQMKIEARRKLIEQVVDHHDDHEDQDDHDDHGDDDDQDVHDDHGDDDDDRRSRWLVMMVVVIMNIVVFTRAVMAKIKTTMAMRLPIFLQRSTEATRGLKS